jgi:hypothetical protein
MVRCREEEEYEKVKAALEKEYGDVTATRVLGYWVYNGWMDE